MRGMSMTGGYFKRFGMEIILSALFLLLAATGWAAPTVTGMQPPNGSMQPVTTTVTATFSEAMDPTTITPGSFRLSRLGGIKAIAAGETFTVVLKGDGTVAAWGWNAHGQCTVPAGLAGVTAIAAGYSHSVALKDDGTVVSWGGSGVNNVPEGLFGVTAIAAAGNHTVALKANGTVVGWLQDKISDVGQSTVPAGLSGVTAIAAGEGHTVALKGDGTVVAWGWNAYGQSTVPAGLSGVTAIAAGRQHTVALRGDGTVVSWGDSGGNTVPVGLSGVIAIAAGGYTTVALKNDGTVVAWGAYSYNLPAGLSGVIAVAVGAKHTVAIKNDGTLVAWGDNQGGLNTVPSDLSVVTAIAAGYRHTVALKGDGTLAVWGYQARPVPAGLSGVTAIAAGDFHTVALKGDGKVVAWGFNSFGETMVPTGLTGVIAISAASYNTVALKADGTVVAWGQNNYGQNTVPAGLTGVTVIAAGGGHNLALKGDSTVVAWGMNNYGQSTVPAGLSGVTAIAAGGGHNLALKGDGTVVAWGWNNYGQSTVPVGLSKVTAIAAWGDYSVALKADGTVVAWGRNNYGQNAVPAGLSGVSAIAAKAGYIVALKKDGTVIVWGWNAPPVPVSPYDESPIEGTVDYDHSTDTATFTPLAPLAPVSTYLATVNTSTRNSTGVQLPADVNWSFSTKETTATVTLDNLTQSYDGTPKTVNATTDPTGLTVIITYNGSTTPPTGVGSYAVVANVSSAGYTGSNRSTLIITKPTYTVGVSVLGGNGDIWCESPVAEGENSLCAITPDANYHLETFSDNNVDQLAAVTGNTYTISNVMADHAIAGTFAINLRAEAGPDQTVPCTGPSGAQVILNGSASIGAETFTWSGPFGTINGVSPTVTIPLGTHIITLTVADGTGRTASDTVVITVFDNSPPLITIMGVANGMTYNLGLVPLATYAASDAQSGLAESAGTLTGTPDAFGCGTFTYTVTATDNAGNTTTSSVTYEVKATPEGTIALIDALVNMGLMPSKTAETLKDTLLRALSAYNDNPNLGDNMMNTFLNQINAALSSDKISSATAALLNNVANYIMVNN